ncbi:MAG: hypothetical protein DCC55_26140 [Chloroflexi bacterium]|nr:MAG: hypothetical protein DCC55_26140 [Chloroflexota bacterium]
MVARITTVQIQPGQVAAFAQLWTTHIEPTVDPLAGLLDLYLLINPKTEHALLLTIHATDADALTCRAGEIYRQLLAQTAGLLVMETLIHNEYVVISL